MKSPRKIQLKEVMTALETLAPGPLQESYDNSGLLVGDPEMMVTGAILSLDCTEEVILEAKKKKVNLVIAHHPILFSGLKRLTGKNYVERTVMTAIREGIAIYAIHTNLDNVADGVNSMICKKLGLENCRILSPRQGDLMKLSTFAPVKDADKIRSALFDTGAGQIGNYSECSFSSEGYGTFKAGKNADPHVGKKMVRHTEKEEKIEVIFEKWKQSAIIQALMSAHPYEEVAYDLYQLVNSNQSTGSGMIGELKKPVSWKSFLKLLKSNMLASVVKHTAPVKDTIQKVAVCGGSGSFLLQHAIDQGADVFVSADFKYHQYFDADSKIMIADIGHYESEQFTPELIKAFLRHKFPTFALHLTGINTNPVNYF